MSKNLVITIFFLALTLLVLGVLVYFSSSTRNSNPTQTFTELPTIELEDIKSTDNFSEIITADSKEHNDVIASIYDDSYQYFTCKQSGKESQVLILIGQYVDQNGVNTFAPSVQTFKDFETRLLDDWSEVLLPAVPATTFGPLTFTTKPLNDEHIVVTEYRVGQTSDNKYQVYYSWVLNYIVIATTEDCLFDTMEGLYDVH
jgi:hypothetical protein